MRVEMTQTHTRRMAGRKLWCKTEKTFNGFWFIQNSQISLLTSWGITKTLSQLNSPPFHHFSLSMLSLPSSCSFSTAPLIAVRYGESTWHNKFHFTSNSQFHHGEGERKGEATATRQKISWKCCLFAWELVRSFSQHGHECFICCRTFSSSWNFLTSPVRCRHCWRLGEINSFFSAHAVPCW